MRAPTHWIVALAVLSSGCTFLNDPDSIEWTDQADGSVPAGRDASQAGPDAAGQDASQEQTDAGPADASEVPADAGVPDSGAPDTGGSDAGGLTELALCPTEATLYVSEPLKLTVMSPGAGAVGWSVRSGGSTATVSQDGLFTATAPGTYVVAAAQSAGAATGQATIEVRDNVLIIRGKVRYPAPYSPILVSADGPGWSSALATKDATGETASFQLYAPAGTPSPATLFAFMDKLGTGRFARGADPSVRLPPADFAAGTPPALQSPPAPPTSGTYSIKAEGYGDLGGIIVFWDRLKWCDATNKCEDSGFATEYRLLNTATNTAVARVREGAGAVAFFPASPGTYNLKLIASGGGRDLAAFPLSPITVPTAAGPGSLVTITVDGVPAGLGAGAQLYAAVFKEGPNGPSAIRLARATPAAPSSRLQILGVSVGDWLVAAFLDANNDGEIGPSEPTTFASDQKPDQALNVTGDVSVTTRLLSEGAAVWARSEFNAGAPQGKYALELGATAAGRIPVRARAIMKSDAVNLSGGDWFSGLRGRHVTQTAPMQGTPIRYDVTFLDGVTCNYSATSPAFWTDSPQCISPTGQIAAGTVNFQWSRPTSRPVAGFRFRVEEAQGWKVCESEWDSTATSASCGLPDGKSFNWSVGARDSAGNSTSCWASVRTSSCVEPCGPGFYCNEVEKSCWCLSDGCPPEKPVCGPKGGCEPLRLHASWSDGTSVPFALDPPQPLDCGGACWLPLPGEYVLRPVFERTDPKYRYLGVAPGSWTGCDEVLENGYACKVVITNDRQHRYVQVKSARLNAVFVTSIPYASSTKADDVCTTLGRTHVDSAGTFLALRTQAALDLVSKRRGWVRTDGKPFMDKLQLSPVNGEGWIWYPPMTDEFSQRISGDALVWTGIDAHGSFMNDCMYWGAPPAGMMGEVGIASGGEGSWLNVGQLDCSLKARLYCIQVDHETPLGIPPRPKGTRLAYLAPFNPGTGGGAGAACAAARPAGMTAEVEPYVSTQLKSAAGRMAQDVRPIFRADGVKVAEKVADLAYPHTREAAINRDAQGGVPWPVPEVFTGAKTPVDRGTLSSTCGDWLAGDKTYMPQVGDPSDTGERFFYLGQSSINCGGNGSVYCIEQ